MKRTRMVTVLFSKLQVVSQYLNPDLLFSMSFSQDSGVIAFPDFYTVYGLSLKTVISVIWRRVRSQKEACDYR